MSENTGRDTNDDGGAISADTRSAASAAPAAPPSASSSASPPPTPSAVPPTPSAAAAPSAEGAPASPEPPLSRAEAAESDKAGLLAMLAEKAAENPPGDGKAAPGEKAAADAAEGVASAADAAAEPGPDTADDAADPGEDDPADTDPLTAEERAAVGAKTARKVSRLLRNVKRLEPDAKAYRNITRYMAENKLTGEEAAKGFEIMALLKQDDPRALAALQPYIERLQRAAGVILPDDLKAKVDQGYLDEDGAREIAALRHSNARAAHLESERAQLVSAHQAEQAHASIASELNAWEVRQQVNPDYAAVKSAVFDYAKASFAAKPPATPAEAVARIEAFYATLRRPAAAGVSRPAAVRPGPSSTLSPARPTAREPQSLAERIQMTLQRRGAA